MKRLAVCGIVVAVVTLLAGAVAYAGSDSNPNSDSAIETLRFQVDFSPFKFLDHGAQGPTLGDETLFNDILIRNGKAVGKEAGFCKVTEIRSDGFDVECLSTVSLAGGQITAQGLTTNAPVKRLAVTGGTGAYLGADGEMKVVEFGNGRGSLTIYLER